MQQKLIFWNADITPSNSNAYIFWILNDINDELQWNELVELQLIVSTKYIQSQQGWPLVP